MRPSGLSVSGSGRRPISDLSLRAKNPVPGARKGVVAESFAFKPTPAARYRYDERSAGLGAYRSTVVWRHGSRHDDFASPFHWCLLPREAHNASLIVRDVGQIVACICLQLDY